jgi:chemotaxis protein methyltransferase CheR
MPLVPSNGALQMLADLIHERTGLQYDANRMDLLVDRLAVLMAESGYTSIMDYYYYLRYDAASTEEWQRLQSALAVNETYFWREFDQIQAAAEIIVPSLQRERPGRPVRIWHAACASGEEPYSMAMALDQTGAYRRGEIEITATDFNLVALADARKAVYRPRSFRSLPETIRSTYFSPDSQERFMLNHAIKARVQFRYLNLMDEGDMAGMRDYDIIFCRNAFIYFSEPAIRQVVSWFYRSLTTMGTLFVAAAESLLRLTSQFDLVEIGNAFAYSKRSMNPEAIKKEIP